MIKCESEPLAPQDGRLEGDFSAPSSPQMTSPVMTTTESKLPFGAMVSRLSPFFSERAKKCTLEMVRAKALGDALSSSQLNKTRSRSNSQSSTSSETLSASVSIASSNSTQSIATAISSIDEAILPPTMPKIPYSEWSKFGISLFTPKQSKPQPQMYYQYSNKTNRARSLSDGNRRLPLGFQYLPSRERYSSNFSGPSTDSGCPVRRSTTKI